MNDRLLDNVIRALHEGATRRGVLGVLTASAGLGLREAAAKKKGGKKKKKCKNCCRRNGSKCKKKSGGCKAGNCLKTPFTIEARWNNASTDHDTNLFVPNEEGASLPAPYIDYSCNPVDSPCVDDVYPFICVSQDATGPGDEVTTVRSLIPGTYEYWIELYQSSPEGDLEVTLRNKGGNVIRSWISPANPNAASQIGWHVFDINGKTRSILSVDETIADSMPSGAHDPNTDVCPTI